MAETLDRAMGLLDLSDVWELAPVDRPRPMKDGMCLSPFREERGASFSVGKGLKVFFDHGSHDFQGGVWEFVRLCRPDWSKREIGRFLIEKAGLEEEPRLSANGHEWGDRRREAGGSHGGTESTEAGDRRREEGGSHGGTEAGDRRQERKAWLRRQRLKEAEAERRAGLVFEEALALPEASGPVDGWPDCVQERFEEGRRAAFCNKVFFKRLKERRGWPLAWTEALVEWGLLSWPLLPWSDSDRGRAFVVLCPLWEGDKDEKGKREAAKGRGRFLGFREVGFHQVWFRKERLGDVWSGRRNWLFVPWAPRSFKANEGSFLATLGRLERSIPPLPFVLGSPKEDTRLVVIAEGQWDAATFWGACGWFDAEWSPADVVVFGLRGARGVDVFLRFYGAWLARVRPAALLLHDADAAGRAWVERVERPGLPPEPCFADRLAAAGCRPVARACPKGVKSDGAGMGRKETGDGGQEAVKDFNDVWLRWSPRPSPQAMLDWLAGLGLWGGREE